jgi:hypothetical protein
MERLTEDMLLLEAVVLLMDAVDFAFVVVVVVASSFQSARTIDC